MSTAAVSSSSLHQQLQTFFQTRLSDVQQLGQSLQSGDLAGAQQAFNNISALGQSGPFASGNAFAISQREQDFSAVGQALQSGNLAGAQEAFATLQSTFRASRAQPVGPASPALPVSTVSPTSGGAEPPVLIINLSSTGASSGAASGTGAPSSPTGASSTGTLASPTGTPEIFINLGSGSGSTPEQVTLTLSNQGSGGEQLTISEGNQQGSNSPQLTLNLSQNEQVVLNLFNATANPAPQSSGVSVVA